LNYYCPIGKWLAVRDKYGVIWSIKKTQDSVHFLSTTSFMPENFSETEVPLIVTEQDLQFLSKMSKKFKMALMERLGIEITDPRIPLEETIAYHFNRRRIEARQANENNEMNQNSQNNELQTKKVQELSQIARNLGLKPQTTKKKIIEQIQRAKRGQETDFSLIKKQLTESSRQEMGIQHDLYRQYFNVVDLHDKYWYKIQCKHRINDWVPKLIISLLYTGLINSWSIFRSFEPENEKTKLTVFAKKIYHYFLDPNFEL